MSSSITRVARWNQGAAMVKPQVKDAWPGDWAEPRMTTLANSLHALVRFVDKTLVIAEFEVRKLRHDFTDMVTRAIQPVLWLLLFGEVFTRVRAIPSGDV